MTGNFLNMQIQWMFKCDLVSFQHLVNLFARLANDNIGYIDWDPYIPKVRC